MNNKSISRKAGSACTRNPPIRKGRFTAHRSTIYDLLRHQKKPIGAYELIELYARKFGRRPAPMMIYRALDFLMEENLVRKIASQNLFIACTHPSAAHQCLFFVCENCGNARETEIVAIDKALAASAAKAGFLMHKRLIEVEGLCSACQTKK